VSGVRKEIALERVDENTPAYDQAPRPNGCAACASIERTDKKRKGPDVQADMMEAYAEGKADARRYLLAHPDAASIDWFVHWQDANGTAWTTMSTDSRITALVRYD